MDGYWVVRTYEAGAVGEKTKFFVPGARPEKRSKRKEKLAEKKAKQNEYSARKALARELNANCDDRWYLVGLDYSPAGMDRLLRYAAAHPCEDKLETIRQAAKHELVNFVRRVQRAADKLGLAVKIIGAVTSDMDGDTGETVRVHHHLVVSDGLIDVLKDKWRQLGSVDYERLNEGRFKDQVDYTEIADYLLRQLRPQPNERKWTSTRNIIVPEPKDRIVVSDSDLRVPKGGELIYRGDYYKGGSQYIRYVLPEGKRTRTINARRE